MEYELIKMLQEMQQRYFRTHDNLMSLRGSHREAMARSAQLQQENASLRDQINSLSRQLEQELGRS